MSICSDEVNYLILRYLQELNYKHTAFTFGCETSVANKPEVANRSIPPGSLAYLIQKGILYSRLENIAEESCKQDDESFNNHLKNMKQSLQLSIDFTKEKSSALRKLRMLPSIDANEPLDYYLSDQASLFLDGHCESVLCSSWSADSKLLATGSSDGCVVIWKFLYNEELCRVDDCPLTFQPVNDPMKEGDVVALAWSPVEPILAAASFCGTVSLYNIDVRESINFDIGTSPISSMGFSSSGVLGVGSCDGTYTEIFKGNTKSISVGNYINDVQWIDESTVLVSTTNNIYRIYQSGDPVSIFKTDNIILHMQISSASSNEKQVVIGDSAGNIIITDKDGQILFSDRGHDGETTVVGIIPESKLIVSGGSNGSICVINKTSKEKFLQTIYKVPVLGVAIDPKNYYFACFGANNIISLFFQENKKLLINFTSVIAGINSLQFSPNGRFLTICFDDGITSIIDFDLVVKYGG